MIFQINAYAAHFIDDLHFILFLEPLFASGLAGFSKSILHWCPNCVRAAAERGILDTLVDEPEEIEWQKKVAKLVRHIEKTFLERGTTLVHQHGDHAHATIFMPDGLLEYDQVQTTLELPPRLAKKAIEPIGVSTRDARKLRLFNDEIERIVDDISTQNATANRFNCQYITDRTIDLELMDMVSNKRTRTFNSLTRRARGRLDSHRQIGFFVALGFVRFVERVSSLQPPVTRAVGQLKYIRFWMNKTKQSWTIYKLYITLPMKIFL
jgi:hypothetical protein